MRLAVKALGGKPDGVPMPSGYDPSSSPGYVIGKDGKPVGDTGVGIPAVKGCIDLISTNIALAEKRIYSITTDGEKKEKPNHPLNTLIKNPSKRYNRFQWELIIWNMVLLHGNAYVLIKRSQRDGQTPVELVPCALSRLERLNGRLRYWLNEPATNFIGLQANTVEVDERDVLHVTALNPNYLTGSSRSPMSFAFNTADLYFRGVTHLNDLLKQGGYPNYLQLPIGTKMKDVTAWWETFKEFFLDNGPIGNIAPTYPGSTLSKVGFSNVDLGILDLFRFDVAEISRIYGVPQSLIGHHEKGSSVRNANIVTADFTSLKKKALLPYSQSFISEFDRKLIKPLRRENSTAQTLVLEFDFRKTDEASEEEKTNISKNKAQSGIFTANEIRRMDWNLPPVEGGDELLQTTGSPERDLTNKKKSDKVDNDEDESDG